MRRSSRACGGDWPARRRLGLTVGCAALLGVLAVPTHGLATAHASVAAPAVATAQLVLSETVDQRTAAVGSTVTYMVTLANTGTIPAVNVTLDDVVSGTAGYRVNDGSDGTVNSFAGSLVVTVTRVASGHYRWTYPTVSPNGSQVVRFTALLRAPATPPSGPNGTISLTNTVSAPGLASAAVTTSAPYTASAPGPRPPAASTGSGSPATGADLDLAPSGFLVLGGPALLLLAALVRRPEDESPFSGARPRRQPRAQSR